MYQSLKSLLFILTLFISSFAFGKFEQIQFNIDGQGVLKIKPGELNWPSNTVTSVHVSAIQQTPEPNAEPGKEKAASSWWNTLSSLTSYVWQSTTPPTEGDTEETTSQASSTTAGATSSSPTVAALMAFAQALGQYDMVITAGDNSGVLIYSFIGSQGLQLQPTLLTMDNWIQLFDGDVEQQNGDISYNPLKTLLSSQCLNMVTGHLQGTPVPQNSPVDIPLTPFQPGHSVQLESELSMTYEIQGEQLIINLNTTPVTSTALEHIQYFLSPATPSEASKYPKPRYPGSRRNNDYDDAGFKS